MISTAARCSEVCGWGQDSLAAMSSSAPSITAAPLSMVAMRMSCPGQSTKDTCRLRVTGDPHWSQGKLSSLLEPWADHESGRSHFCTSEFGFRYCTWLCTTAARRFGSIGQSLEQLDASKLAYSAAQQTAGVARQIDLDCKYGEGVLRWNTRKSLRWRNPT